MSKLLVTGMLRSGTTLLEKALNAHPDVHIVYQPFPELFIDAKKRFYTHLGHTPPYHALSHYCLESRYTPTDLTNWLNQQQFTRSFIAKSLPSDKAHLLDASFPSNNFFSDWYADLLHPLDTSKSLLCLGSKEVLVEEFMPHLIHHNIYCMIIIRDPRDVITSLDFGQGNVFTGDHRPTLFNLRNWRKSVDFALAFNHFKNFCMIRFEDLVLQPVDTLNKISAFIGLREFNEKWWQRGFRNSNGTCWKGNSSFGDIQPFDPNSIGGHLSKLPETTRLYIESICRREMRAMDYSVSPASLDQCKKRISGFRDPFVIRRCEFDPDYSHLPENVGYEIKRLENPDPAFFLLNHTAERLMRLKLWQGVPHQEIH